MLKMDGHFLPWCCVLSILLFGRVVSQQQKDPEEGLIMSIYAFFSTSHLVSYPGDVNAIKQKDDNKELEPNKYFFNYSYTDVSSIAIDTDNQSLYYIDMQSHGMYRLRHANVSLKKSAIKEEEVHQGISSSVGTIAFDWISKNLYWTDRYHNWIAMRPANSKNPLMYKIVLEIQIIVPVGLAIDPLADLMFWSDTMPSRRVERSSLLGENRTVLLSQSMEFITAISVDHVTRRIYWIDYLRQTLETATYDGLDRKVIRMANGVYLTGLALFRDHLCVIDQSNSIIACLDKKNGETAWYDEFGYFDFTHAVAAYDKTAQPASVTNHCASVKCQHFCVSTKSGAKCVCQEGYKLQNDKLTCKARHVLDKKGLMFTNGTHICVFDMHIITNAKHEAECIVANLTGISGFLQTDNSKGHIFFWNATAKEIRKINTVTKRVSFVASTSASVSGMFYDWLDDSILWSEDDTGSIKRVYLRNLDFNSVFTNIKGVSYLTANPHNQTMYWISGSDDNYLIEGGSMTGTGRYTVLGSKGVTKPSNLFYDEIYFGLYFVDEEEVKNILTNGSNMESRMSVGGVPASLIVYKDYVVWTNNKADIRVAFVIATSRDRVIQLTDHKNVIGICAFDPRLQRPKRGPCEDGNGGCQHICIHKTNDTYVCQCSFGYKLAADGKRCKSEILKNNFALISDHSHGRIYQIPVDKPFNVDNIVAVDMPSIEYVAFATYDKTSDYLYWTDFMDQKIVRVRMTGENETTILTLKSHYPHKMVFDMSTGDLYYTALFLGWSGDTSYIGVLKLGPGTNDIKHRKLIEDLNEPSGLALYPKKGLMFWVDFVSKPYIGRSYMTGKKIEKIITEDLVTPMGLTIDYTADRIYWADQGDETIKSATLDGKDIRTLITDKNSIPVELSIQGSYLFYIGWNQRNIGKVDLKTGTKVEWMPDVPELGRLDSIQLIPSQPQPVSVTCSIKAHNHGCSTFCLPMGNTAICECEDGVNKRDNRHCENVCRDDIFEHVKLQRDCVIRHGGRCNYTCTGHLSKNKRIPTIKCLPNGTWDQPERNLCSMTECSTSLPDVYVSRPCSNKIGVKCLYSCKDSTLQKGYTSMKCSSGGVWVPRDSRCKAPSTLKCSADLKNGKFASDCSRLAVNTECKFTCNGGYMAPHGIDTMVCHRDGTWSFDISTLCSASAPSVGMQTAEQQAVAVGGGLGAVAIIMIIVVVVLLVCFLRKSRAPKKQDREFLEPESINVSRRGSERQSYPKSADKDDVSPDPVGAYVTIARNTPINARTQQTSPSSAQTKPQPQATPQTTPYNAQSTPRPQITPQTAPTYAQAVPRPQATPQTAPTFTQATPRPQATPQTAPTFTQATQRPQATPQTSPTFTQEETPRPQVTPQAAPTFTQATSRPQATTTNPVFGASATQPGQHKTTISTQPGSHKSVINIGKPGGNPYEKLN